MSVQSLNGDSYQGGQVGANIQSQVGTSSIRAWNIFVVVLEQPIRDRDSLDLNQREREVTLCPWQNINTVVIVNSQLYKQLRQIWKQYNSNQHP